MTSLLSMMETYTLAKYHVNIELWVSNLNKKKNSAHHKAR